MAKKKIKKYTKRPKQSAGLQVLKNWLKKCDEIDKENKKIVAENKELEKVKEKVRNRRQN